MSRLVISADDAGLAASTDAAILRCCRDGVVCCASVVAGGPSAESFLDQARGIDLGLHVNLTEGRALAGPAASLTDREGVFTTPKQEVWRRARAGRLDAGDVRREVLAQLAWLRRRGVEPSHVNGHNHVHVFPVVREALPGLWVRVPLDADLAPELVEAARTMSGASRHADRFTGYAFCHDPTPRVFLESIPARADLIEFMVHPGSRPGTPFTEALARDRETEVLCSAGLRAELDRRGVELTCFKDLACT